MLEYVLSIGNILNSGSNRGAAYGFRLHSLPKVTRYVLKFLRRMYKTPCKVECSYDIVCRCLIIWGSTLVYRYTRADTKDQAYSLPINPKKENTIVITLCTDTPRQNLIWSVLNYLVASYAKPLGSILCIIPPVTWISVFIPQVTQAHSVSRTAYITWLNIENIWGEV